MNTNGRKNIVAGLGSILLLILSYPVVVILAVWVFKAPLDKMGQFGDSVAPVTALLAALAAYASVRAYQSQLRTADFEKARAARDHFDDQFFKLLAHYDELASRCSSTRELASDDLNWLSPSSSVIFHPDKTVTLGGIWVVIDVMARAQMRWQEELRKKRETSYCETFFVDLTINLPMQLQLAPVVDTIVALLETLSLLRDGVDLKPYSRLLCARISNLEREVWQLSVARMGIDSHVFKFACELGLIVDDPAPLWGGWPYFVMYKKGRTLSFWVRDMAKWSGDVKLVQP